MKVVLLICYSNKNFGFMKIESYLASKIDFEIWICPIFASSASNCLKRYEEIISGCSLGCKNALNFTRLTMKFHNRGHTNKQYGIKDQLVSSLVFHTYKFWHIYKMIVLHKITLQLWCRSWAHEDWILSFGLFVYLNGRLSKRKEIRYPFSDILPKIRGLGCNAT